MKKFISPGSWFAFAYPEEWFEFSEEADCFLFYNPEKWDGNFRISAYRDASSSFGDSMMRQALKTSGAKLSKVGRWETIYSTESFTEQLVEYTTHRWTIGCGQTCVECSFTEEGRGESLGTANAIIASYLPTPPLPLTTAITFLISEPTCGFSNKDSGCLLEQFALQFEQS